ncbi:hypothetical protein [Neorhizobium vignae]|uniref:hypothetical protein n=1 Tax=Neorhizobium vignae TaxID=690585 RepID=UPI00056CC6DA|nr:hypothetical protein [Neorhizobium vignae]
MIGAGRDIIVKIVAGAVSEVVRQGSIGILDTVYGTGEPFIARDLLIKLNRGPEGEEQDRFTISSTSPCGTLTAASRVFWCKPETLPKLRAEEKRREVLAYKLGYLLKNSLP